MRTFWPMTIVWAATSCCLPLFGDISWSEDDEEPHTPIPQRRVVMPARQPGQDIQQLSEAFGYFIGQDISKQGIHFNIDAVIKGIQDAVTGNPPPMQETEYEEAVANFRDKHFQEVANFNLTLADSFMLSNGKKTEVVQAVPGKVQFTTLQRGRGRQVEAHSVPVLRYTGRFLDGSAFAETEQGQALPVPLDDMIPGFRDGVIGMREGERRRIFIHPDAAYGVTGDLAPNSLLVFEVQVVDAGNQPSLLNTKAQPRRQAPAPRPLAQQIEEDDENDSWDLSLDDTLPLQEASGDDFSTRRLLLKPVSYNSQQPKTKQQPQRSRNNRAQK